MRNIQGYKAEPYQDYSAMRGPCPEGFHIPFDSEATTLGNIVKAFGLPTGAGGNAVEYLKMPRTGLRYNSAGYFGNEVGQFWLCTVRGRYGRLNYGLNSNSNSERNKACVVRPFKDTAVTPDSSWTILYNGSSVATGAGIFWNPNQGIISASSDGINRITIADKNVGATTVGTDKNDACVGYVFQWGNNHGFTYSTLSSISKSPDKVDASGYGPGNYYNSSTFISDGTDTDWSSVQNDNLRGGVTGVKTGYRII